MARKKHSAEQVVAILRQIEVEVAHQKPLAQACKEAGITEQTYYRWRKEYGGLKLEQARRLKQLEKENGRLPRFGQPINLRRRFADDLCCRSELQRFSFCPKPLSIRGRMNFFARFILRCLFPQLT